jgi:MHS family proline/betaine transporter-like MFS transporter
MTVAETAGARSNILSGMIGNVLEWYDFGLYGFLAPIIAVTFFPADAPAVSLLAAFGVFAAGYAARPLGGAVFGWLGDKVGRKPSLIISVTVMGVATFLIGLLPTHAQLGIAAPALLIFLRIAQGLSVGGEYTGSMVFLAEHAPDEKRGLQASWTQFGCLIGFLLGSAIGGLTSKVLGETAMYDWGWRIPFLLSGVIAVAGLVLRRTMTETPVMAALDTSGRSPLAEVFLSDWRIMLRIIALIAAGAVGFYMIFIYSASYLTTRMDLTTAQALNINAFNLLVMLALTPPAAMLSDRFGRRPLLFVAVGGGLVFGWPLWWLMHQDALPAIVFGQMGFAVMFGISFATVPATIAELLPPEVRVSGTSIAYNLSVGIFGGSAPLVATYLVAQTGSDLTPIYYFMAASIPALFVLATIPETARKPLP